MQEHALRRLIVRLGYSGAVRRSGDDWLLLPCLLAKWKHAKKADRHPSLSISIKKGEQSFAHCFACGFKGNVASLIQHLADYREDPALEQLAEEIAVDDSLATLETNYEEPIVKYERKGLETLNSIVYYRIYPPVAEFKAGRAYCARRGILREAAELLNLRYDEEQSRVLFPVEDVEGNLYGFTGRSVLPNPECKIRDYEGLKKANLFLGLNLIDNTKPILLVEGLFAYAHLVAIGAREFCNPLAALGATASISKQKLDWLLEVNQRVVLLLDNDKAGREGAENMQKQISEFLPCAIADYPKGKDDPDNLNLEEIKEIIESTRLCSIKI